MQFLHLVAICTFVLDSLRQSEIFLSREGIALSNLIKQNINALFNFHNHSFFYITNIDYRDEKFNFTGYFFLMLPLYSLT